MLTSVQIVDKIKDLKKCNDAEVGRLLGVTRSAVSFVKNRGGAFEEDTALRAADLLEIPHEDVLLWNRIERAKRPEARRAWENIAKALGSTFTALLFFFMSLVTAPQPAQAAIEMAPSLTPVYYVKRLLRRLSLALWGFCSTFTSMDFATARIRSFVALLLSAALAACGSENSSNDEPAPPAGPCETFGRVCVYHDPGVVPSALFLYDLWYRLGAECVASSLNRNLEELPVAVVRVTAQPIRIEGTTTDGRFSSGSGQITILENAFNALAHESVHHALYFFSQDFSHKNPAFGTCVPFHSER